ncbi:MAG: hypothetical protein M9893_09400 [Pyrinomonadaceae bacterium]|nr:hypothetical protein [Pyrinomonadaceae bacterium]
MAKVRKSTVTKRKATRKNSNSKRRARTPEYGRFVLPMFISMVLLVAIAFLGLMVIGHDRIDIFQRKR